LWALAGGPVTASSETGLLIRRDFMSASQPLLENFSEHFTFLNLLKYHTGPSELRGNCFGSNLYGTLVDFGTGSGLEGGARCAVRVPWQNRVVTVQRASDVITTARPSRPSARNTPRILEEIHSASSAEAPVICTTTCAGNQPLHGCVTFGHVTTLFGIFGTLHGRSGWNAGAR
jgi:hypothetical protein